MGQGRSADEVESERKIPHTGPSYKIIKQPTGKEQPELPDLSFMLEKFTSTHFKKSCK